MRCPRIKHQLHIILDNIRNYVQLMFNAGTAHLTVNGTTVDFAATGPSRRSITDNTPFSPFANLTETGNMDPEQMGVTMGQFINDLFKNMIDSVVDPVGDP